MAIVLGLGQSAPSHAEYFKYTLYYPACPEGTDITTTEECIEAAEQLNLTIDRDLWTGSFEVGPPFCSYSKKLHPLLPGIGTNQMVFNQNENARTRRKDLAPICKGTGIEIPPEFYRVSQEDVTELRGVEHTITVKPEEWNYFLAFQESRKNGFSCPCNPDIGCNEIEAPGRHYHPPNPEKLTYDCAMWFAAYMHAEDMSIQSYCDGNHLDRKGWSPRMRCTVYGTVCPGEHAICPSGGSRHTTGPSALAGLQSSPGHCNSMYDPRFKGVAVGHGSRADNRNAWVVTYNFGGSDIKDSESCIPEGYTATGELKESPTTPPSPTTPTSPTTPAPTTPTPVYQMLDFGDDACPEGLEIESELECSDAIASLGVTNGGMPWTGSRTTMPKGCSLQKTTNSTVFNTGQGGSGRHDLAPVCKEPSSTAPIPAPTPTPLPATPDYQMLGFGEDACPEGLEIESELECRDAIAALGVTNGATPWTGSRTTMPKGCSLQKDTDARVFNTGQGGSGRHDLAPVCKLIV